MKKRIIITGASGFLGINLLREGLSHDEYELWAATSNQEKIVNELKTEKIQIVSRDYPLSKEFQNQEFWCVINCAYPRNSNGFEIALGLDYIEKLFKSISKGQVRSIINISSQSVYDDQRTEPATEESPISLKTPYAVGKYMTEKMLDAICKDIPHTSVRMASLIGPGFDQRIVNRFVKNSLEHNSIMVNISKQKFGFLDVRDATQAIFSLLLHNINPNNWETIYNVGNGQAYSISEIALKIKEVLDSYGNRVDIVTGDLSDIQGSTCVDCDKLMKKTGYLPRFSLIDSILHIYNTIKSSSTQK